MSAGEEKIQCPFDGIHWILPNRMAKHISQCKKNYPNTNLVVCPYNLMHYCPQQEIEYHKEYCPDARELERVIYQNKSNVKPIDEDIYKKPILVGVEAEDWSQDCAMSYLDKRAEVISKKPLLLQGELNTGKAARKNFLKGEKARIQFLQGDTPSSSGMLKTNLPCDQ